MGWGMTQKGYLCPELQRGGVSKDGGLACSAVLLSPYYVLAASE